MSADFGAQIGAYTEAMRGSPPDACAVADVRFVVLDAETTGTDPRRDRIISLGAVAVRDGEICLDDSFEALIQIEYNGPSVAVHGITREESLSGVEEAEAVAGFLAYLGCGVIVGHHIEHDVIALDLACQRNFGIDLANRFLDTMELTLHLEKDGAFAGAAPIAGFSLDALAERFGVVPHDRHTAAGDAFITAQIFQKLLRHAHRCGRRSLASLAERFTPEHPDAAPV